MKPMTRDVLARLFFRHDQGIKWYASVGSVSSSWRYPIAAMSDPGFLTEEQKRQIDALNSTGYSNTPAPVLTKEQQIDDLMGIVLRNWREEKSVPPTPRCECGAEKCGGNHSSWCPKFEKEEE